MSNKVYPKEIVDIHGNLTRIEFVNVQNDAFEFDALWDQRDEQTSENKHAFRKWANRMARQMGYEVK